MEKTILNHRNPMILEKDKAYYVVSGTINLFLIKTSNKQDDTCKRSFLMSVAGETAVLGAQAVMEHGTYKVMVVGSGNAEVESGSVSEMGLTRESIMKWLKYISDQREMCQLKDKQDGELEALLSLAEKETQLYIEAKADALHLKNKMQEETFVKKKQKDAILIHKSIKLLTDHKMTAVHEQSGSIFYQTCLAAANALNLEVSECKPLSPEIKEPQNIIKAHLEQMNIKYRRVKLNGSWQRNADGVMIAFKENKQPVVIAPKGEVGRYERLDVENGTCTLVDKDLAGSLLKDAFMLYRSLPKKAISGKQLLGFGLNRIAKRDMILLVFSFIAIGLLGMTTPLLTGLTIDWIIPQGDFSLLFQMGIMMAVFTLTTYLFNLVRNFTILRIEGQLDVTLQTAIWDRLLNLPLGFFKQFTSAELASRALGITMIRDIISGPVLEILMTGVYSLFSWLVLFYYNVHLALIASLMAAVCIIVNYFLAKKGLYFEHQVNQYTNRLAGLSFQLVNGAVKVQQSGAVERAYYKWAKEEMKKHEAMQHKGLITSKIEGFNGLYLPLSMGIIYYLITNHSAFSLPVGHFVGFNAAYMLFIAAILNIFGSMHILFKVIPLYQLGKVILETKPEGNEDKKVIEELTGKISVDHVQFQYSPEGAVILKDVSLEISPGEYVGIVGTSGSGKSTLMRLLMGFETLSKGKITYDDQDINSLNLKELRKQIGIVLQNGKLMTDSIYHNIIGTNLHLTMEDAWAAAKIAGIDEDIKAMPMGMHTIVMEGAGTISGGQKQRILIARAVVNKPKILFFDEATSALDNITQANIKKSLDQFLATRIVIAHRLSTVKNCDRIIVLDHGEVKETGSYEELIKHKGIFYQIAKRQLT